MQKISTMRTSGKNICKGQLTMGFYLGDRSSSYCVLNEAGEIVLEHKLATTPEAMKQVFGRLPRCRIAMETGTHSPWVSRTARRVSYFVRHRLTEFSVGTTPRDGRGALCRVPACLHCGFRLMLQKNSESESVRNQQQRHYQSGKEECGSQLPR